MEGDADRSEDVRKAARGVDAIVYGLNLPYKHWQDSARPLLEITLRIAEEDNLLIVFPANVYVFNPNHGPEFTEHNVFEPISEKGKVRAQMERRLQRASQNGARVLIIRAGDFIGRNASGSWLAQLLIQRRGGYTLLDPTTEGHRHSWAYLGDLAGVTAELMGNSPEHDAYEVFHFRGQQLTMADIKAAIESQTKQSVKIKPFPWWLVRIAASFVRAPKELLEMRYLWEQEVNLNQQKLEKVLQRSPEQTPLADALVQSGLLDQGSLD
mgnify:CR=1 FL=1